MGAYLCGMKYMVIAGYASPEMQCVLLENGGDICILSGTGNESIGMSSGGALTDDDFN